MIEPRLPAYGITRVADLTELDVLGIPVFAAVRPGATTLSCSQGKGLTSELARLSAVMEGLERAAAEEYQPIDSIEATFREMSSFSNDFPLGRPSLLTEMTVLEWVPARDIVTDEQEWVPRSLVGFDGRSSFEWCPQMLVSSTNGLAAGNSAGEATVHALWEVLERHHVCHLSALSIEARTYIDPESVTDRDCRELIERITRCAFEIEIVSLADSPAYSVFAVYLRQEDMPDVYAGSGAHSDASIALSRAVTEAAQSRLTVISGARDDIPASAFRVRRRHEPYSRSTGVSLTDWSAVAAVSGRPVPRDFSEEAVALATILREITGRSPLIVEIGASDEPFAVCRVIAPGCQIDIWDKFSREPASRNNPGRPG